MTNADRGSCEYSAPQFCCSTSTEPLFGPIQHLVLSAAPQRHLLVARQPHPSSDFTFTAGYSLGSFIDRIYFQTRSPITKNESTDPHNHRLTQPQNHRPTQPQTHSINLYFTTGSRFIFNVHLWKHLLRKFGDRSLTSRSSFPAGHKSLFTLFDGSDRTRTPLRTRTHLMFSGL